MTMTFRFVGWPGGSVIWILFVETSSARTSAAPKTSPTAEIPANQIFDMFHAPRLRMCLARGEPPRW
jgi:hypothetical protein